MNTTTKGINIECVKEILSRDTRFKMNEFRHVCNKKIRMVDDCEVESTIKSLESKYSMQWINSFLHASLDTDNNFYRSVTWESFEEAYVGLYV